MKSFQSHCKGRDEMQGLQRVKGETQLCSYDIFNLQKLLIFTNESGAKKKLTILFL